MPHRPDIVYIQGVAYDPLIPIPDLTIQIIEFTFTHNKFLDQAIQTKEDKYNPSINTLRAQGWNIRPLIVITVGVKGAIHTRSVELLENLHIPTSQIVKKMKIIHQIAIKYLTYLVLNKRKLDNKQEPELLLHIVNGYQNNVLYFTLFLYIFINKSPPSTR